MLRSLRAAALLVSLGLFVPCVLACSTTPHAHFYTAPTTFSSGLHVRLQEAKTSNDRLYVKMWFMNTTPEPIHVDRDGMSLKLRSGEILPRSVGVTTRHNIWLFWKICGCAERNGLIRRVRLFCDTR